MKPGEKIRQEDIQERADGGAGAEVESRGLLGELNLNIWEASVNFPAEVLV